MAGVATTLTVELQESNGAAASRARNDAVRMRFSRYQGTPEYELPRGGGNP